MPKGVSSKSKKVSTTFPSKDPISLSSGCVETCSQGVREARVPKGGHPTHPRKSQAPSRGLKGKSLELEGVVAKETEANESKDTIPDYDETPLDVLESTFER